MTLKPRVLLANEGGHGRGHLVTLRSIAQALGTGFDYDAALAGMDYAAELDPVSADVYAGIRLTYDASHRQHPRQILTSTWGEFLADLGFRDAEVIRRNIKWWQNVIIDRGIEVLVAEYAPMALLAAQTLKARNYPVTTIAAATGYGLPPADMPEFPVLIPEFDEMVFDEADTLSIVNGVLAEFSVPPLPGLPAIYRADIQLALSIPLLDPYFDHRKTPILPPAVERSRSIAIDGKEIFVYFSTSELKLPGMVDALIGLNLPMRGFLPGASEAQRDALATAGFKVEPKPVSVNDIARRSKLVLHSGQHGIMCLSMFSGLSQLAVPQHLEQLYHARCGERAGVCHTVDFAGRSARVIADAIRHAYQNREMQQRAHVLARDLRRQLPADPRKTLRARLAPVVQAFDTER